MDKVNKDGVSDFGRHHGLASDLSSAAMPVRATFCPADTAGSFKADATRSAAVEPSCSDQYSAGQKGKHLSVKLILSPDAIFTSTTQALVCVEYEPFCCES